MSGKRFLTRKDEKMVADVLSASLSRRAVYQRINRKLAHDNKRLCKSRSYGELNNLGEHYVLDMYSNTVIETHITEIEPLARELGVLAECESIAE